MRQTLGNCPCAVCSHMLEIGIWVYRVKQSGAKQSKGLYGRLAISSVLPISDKCTVHMEWNTWQWRSPSSFCTVALNSQSDLFLFFFKTIYTVLALSRVLNAAKCADKIGKDLECNTSWVGVKATRLCCFKAFMILNWMCCLDVRICKQKTNIMLKLRVQYRQNFSSVRNFIFSAMWMNSLSLHKGLFQSVSAVWSSMKVQWHIHDVWRQNWNCLHESNSFYNFIHSLKFFIPVIVAGGILLGHYVCYPHFLKQYYLKLLQNANFICL